MYAFWYFTIIEDLCVYVCANSSFTHGENVSNKNGNLYMSRRKVPIHAFELKKKKSFMLWVVWYGKPFIGAVHAPINKTIKSVTRIVDNSCVTSNLFECSVNGKHMRKKQMSNIFTVNIVVTYSLRIHNIMRECKNFTKLRLVNV